MISFLRRLFGKRASGAAARRGVAGDRVLVVEPVTYDYTLREWGHDYAITSTEDFGNIIQVSGWGSNWGARMVAGDFVILPNGAETTRYQISRILYYADPPDQWRATMIFAPRTS